MCRLCEVLRDKLCGATCREVLCDKLRGATCREALCDKLRSYAVRSNEGTLLNHRGSSDKKKAAEAASR